MQSICTPVPARLRPTTHKEELLPLEHNGTILARERGERTAGVGYTWDDLGWIDFGTSTRRANGEQDAGDARELEDRIGEQSKSEIIRQVARDLVKEARRPGVCSQKWPTTTGMGPGVHDAGGMGTPPGKC